MIDLPFHVDPRAAAEDGSELQIQMRFRKDMRRLAPSVRLVAVPNGMVSTGWGRIKAAQEGLAKGFPDLLALAPGGLSAYVEIKAKDGTLSDAQIDWLNWLHRNGRHVGVFRGSLSACRFLHGLGFPFLCGLEALAA